MKETDVMQVKPDSQQLLSQMPPSVRDAARDMLHDPYIIERIVDDVAACGVAGERELIATVYLIGTSRLLDDPLGAIVQAPSSTGKSYVVEKAAVLFPQEAVIHATSVTPQALYYMPVGTLSHKFVVAGERSRYQDDQTADATKALRELRSSGRLSKLVTETKGSQLTTRRVEQKGPIAYIETTTSPNIFAEDANRGLILSTDESPEQTRAIMQLTAASRSGHGTSDEIVQRHHAIQRMIRKKPVFIPFGEALATLFPANRPEARRAFGQLLGMVKAIALLHQFQRDTDDGRIVAELNDYETARRLVSQPLSRSLAGQISGGAIRFYEKIKAGFGRTLFNTTEAVQRAGLSRQVVNDYLWELSSVGAVQQHTPRQGNKAATWQLEEIDWDEFASRCSMLPLVSEVEGLCNVGDDLTQNLLERREFPVTAAVSGEHLEEAAAWHGDPPSEELPF